MRFTKMQGIGNDYVYVDCTKTPLEHPEEVAVKVSDRHFGIGSDGLILICPSEAADFQMVMYNADGSRAQMCGNGIRCVGKFVHDKGLTDKTRITVETLGGIKTLDLHLKDGAVDTVTVDMGAPEFRPERLPMAAEGEDFIGRPVTVEGREVRLTGVSMGNPHAVVFVEDPDSLDLPKIGPAFEHHPLFPERVNTEFARVKDRRTIRMRVWERGAGETLACGTGACATLAAAVKNGLTDRQATLELLGGSLEIRWDEESGHIFMTGPARFVFEGEIDPAKIGE